MKDGQVVRLKIEHAKNMDSLPPAIGKLTALQTLTLKDCPKLPALPSGIRVSYQQQSDEHTPQTRVVEAVT